MKESHINYDIHIQEKYTERRTERFFGKIVPKKFSSIKTCTFIFYKVLRVKLQNRALYVAVEFYKEYLKKKS